MKTTSTQNRWLRLDRMLTGSLWKQFSWITGILFAVWGLSYVFLSCSGSAWQEYCDCHGVRPWLLPLYLLIDTNALNNLYYVGKPEEAVHGWMLIVSSITYLIGLFIFNGVIISVLSNYIAQRKENYQNGVSRYFASGHYVIMGYDEMVPSVIASIFRKNPKATIYVLSAVESIKIRERLRKAIPREQFEHIVVNYGHRIARDYYPDIHLEKAKEIFVIGKRTLPNHDAVNVECAESIFNYLSSYANQNIPKRVTCVFEDFDTYSAFKVADIFEKARILNIDFVPYNYYVGWAKQVLLAKHYYCASDNTLYKYPSIYRGGIGYRDEHYVHLVFVGTSTFAVAFALEAAQMLHFPNGVSFSPEGGSRTPIKTKITFIDKNAFSEMQLFRTRHRHFFEVQSCYYRDLAAKQLTYQVIPPTLFEKENSDFLDIDFEFINGDIYSEQTQNLLTSWAEDKNQYLSVFLAHTNQRDNFCLGMNMPDAVYDNAIPIFIRQDNSDTFVTQLRQAHLQHSQRYANIYPFGMNETAFYYNETDDYRARVINYLYHSSSTQSAQQIDQLKQDISQSWQILPIALKWSNLYAAEMIPCKLESMAILASEQALTKEEQIICMAEVEHNRWNVEKLLMGYRKPKKEETDKFNTDAKTYFYVHPDIRPFNQLGEISDLDKTFTTNIPQIIEMASLYAQ